MRGALQVNITFTSRKTELDQKFKERAERKLKKFDRFFSDANAKLTVSKERDRFTVEITIKSRSMVFRAENTATDVFDALEGASDLLFRQIIKNKTRLEKRLREGAFAEPIEGYSETDIAKINADAHEDDDEYRIIKTKRFPVKPMMLDEAILQMNMLGHSFFIFRNGETEAINVVYKRKHGGFGLIEPEE